jgi:copper homeostasis protein
MNIEICTDSLEGVLAAEKYGAKRVELCSGLSIGGLTPSIGLVEECRKKTKVEIHAIIRHREGDFIYNDADIDIMKTDIKSMKMAGVTGVVFGILDVCSEISNLNSQLQKYSKSLDLEVTFHRAFDFVIDPILAIEKIIDYEFDRILTSGLAPTAFQGINIIKDLQSNYGSQIQIMAGSGINPVNVVEIAATGISNIHFSARKPRFKSIHSMGEMMIVDEEKIKNIINQF